MQTPDSQKLREQLAGWYRELHDQQKFAGLTYRDTLPDLRRAYDAAGLPADAWAVDYGCGPRGGLAAEGGPWRAVAYDPYVPGLQADPWADARWQAFYSCDVFEHLTTAEVLQVLGRVAARRPRLVFLAVATRAANKRFPNGLNLHLTVEPAAWWLGVCQAALPGYRAVQATEDLLAGRATLAFAGG